MQKGAYRSREVELLHYAVVGMVLLGVVALIKNEQIDLPNLHQAFG